MVSDVYFPHIGGIPVHIHNLSRELRKLGHEVKVLTANFTSKLLDVRTRKMSIGLVAQLSSGLTSLGQRLPLASGWERR